MKRLIFRHDLTSVERLRCLFDYDAVTGALTWRVKPNRRIVVGSTAGNKTKGYYSVKVDGVVLMAHRIIWKIVTGQEPPQFIDHADRDGTNNAWSNLRAATCSQNGYNRKAQKNKSGAKGVRWNISNRKWEASFRVDKKWHYVGTFNTVEQASAAANSARQSLHGEFARAL